MRLNALTLHVGLAVLIWIAGLGAPTSSSANPYLAKLGETLAELLLRQTSRHAWYIVCIKAQNVNRRLLSRDQRFTIALESADAVRNAHRQFTEDRERWQLRKLAAVKQSNGNTSFLFSDLNGNWWEIIDG